MVFEQDLELRYTWIDNPALDLDPAEIIGRTDHDLFEAPEDAAATNAIKRRVLETGEGERHEIRIRHNGGDHYFDLSVDPMYDEAGAIVGVICASFETTQRRRTEIALAESEALLRAVLEQMPVSIGIFNPDGQVEVVSRYAEAIYGAPKGPRGTRLALEHPDGRPYANEEYPSWRALNLGETIVAEPLRHRHVDGEVRHVEGYAAPVRDAQGRLIAAVTASFDVSERDRTARLLAEARESLEAKVADRTRALNEAATELAAEMTRREQAQATLLHKQRLDALGEMTSGVAHDFRNVLAAASASFSLLGRRVADPKAIELIQSGQESLDRANRLIDRLLAFGRREELRPEALDLVTTLPHIREFARHSLGPGFRCDLAVDPEAWPVLADLSQLEVAILNLVVNARDAMPSGGPIELGASNLGQAAANAARLPPKDYVSVFVRDYGGGMPPDVLACAVQPFFTTKERDKGTGLGLPMVDSFARRSGGALRISSEPGVGTVVEIILPKADASHSASAGSAAILPEKHIPADILLVDDDEPLRAMTAMHLRDIGHSVVEAGNAEAANALAHSMSFLDLVITDLAMPGAGGLRLAERLRVDRPDLPVLFVTGNAQPAEEAGYPVLRKPFRLDELSRAIVEALSRRARPHD